VWLTRCGLPRQSDRNVRCAPTEVRPPRSRAWRLMRDGRSSEIERFGGSGERSPLGTSANSEAVVVESSMRPRPCSGKKNSYPSCKIAELDPASTRNMMRCTPRSLGLGDRLFMSGRAPRGGGQRNERTAAGRKRGTVAARRWIDAPLSEVGIRGMASWAGPYWATVYRRERQRPRAGTGPPMSSSSAAAEQRSRPASRRLVRALQS